MIDPKIGLVGIDMGVLRKWHSMESSQLPLRLDGLLFKFYLIADQAMILFVGRKVNATLLEEFTDRTS
jgi:hypothetical protein